MKKALRLISLLGVAAMMLFVMAGCSNNDAPDDKNEPEDGEGADGEGTPEDGTEVDIGGKTYIISSDTAFPPFEFLDLGTGGYVGIDMDILQAVAVDQSFKYEVRNIGFDPAMGEVEAGQADGMIAGMTIRDDRRERFDFSDPYFQTGQVMVVAANSDVASLEDLRGKTVAAKMGTAGTDYAESVAQEYSLTLVYYEDSPTMYAAVLQGTNAVCFEDYPVIEYAISSEGLALKTVGEVLNRADYGFAVKKGQNAELLEKFNAGLASIKENGTYAEILQKYGVSVDE